MWGEKMKKYIPYFIMTNWDNMLRLPCREDWYECAEGYAVNAVHNLNADNAKMYDTEEEAIERAKELAKTFDEKRYSIGKCSFCEYETQGDLQ